MRGACPSPPSPSSKTAPRHAEDRSSSWVRWRGDSGRRVWEGFPKEGAIGAGPDQVPLERRVGKVLLAEQSACTKDRQQEALSGHREFGGV